MLGFGIDRSLRDNNLNELLGQGQSHGIQSRSTVSATASFSSRVRGIEAFVPAQFLCSGDFGASGTNLLDCMAA